MQASRPAAHWEFQDACLWSSVPFQAPATYMAQPPSPELIFLSCDSVNCIAQPPSPCLSFRSCNLEDGLSDTDDDGREGQPLRHGTKSNHGLILPLTPDLNASIFAGTVRAAFCNQLNIFGSTRQFSPPEVLVVEGCSLGEPVTFGDVRGLGAIFHALLGPSSTFRHELANGESAEVSPLQRAEAWPHVVGGTVTQMIKVPVKGNIPFEEDLRAAVCSGGLGFRVDDRWPEDTAPCVAIQLLSVAQIGWPIGDLQTEVLHLFVQESLDGPICLRTFGKVPSGRTRDLALHGLRDTRARFVTLAMRHCGSI